MALFPKLYDAVMVAAERAFLGRWRRAVVAPATGTVLEIAAGTGLDFAHYTRNAVVIATEPDLGMLQRAKGRVASSAATIFLVAADAEALPFPADVFDGAVVGLALCTIPHPERALGEIRRVTRSGGFVRLLEHVRLRNPVIGRLQDLLSPVWSRLAGGCRLDRDSVAYVERSGLSVEHLVIHAGGYVVEIAARVTQGRIGVTPPPPRVRSATARRVRP